MNPPQSLTRIHWLPYLVILAGLAGSLTGFGDGSEQGHSVAGAAFNEGPRQAATLLEPEEVGRVEFLISTALPKAQQFFNQGVAQLHGFWFYEAERSFRQVLQLDPSCAMAYWGLAVANRSNPKRAREFLEKAKPLMGKVTAKEKRWLEAYQAFFEKDGPPSSDARRKMVETLESLAFDFPEDVEVKVALVLHVWENSSHGIPIGSREGLDALLREVLLKQEWHPGAHHLRIHLWYEQDDRRALKSAAVCGQSGPGVAHLWHMSGHTFSGLKRYSDAAWQQEASARTDHSWMIQKRLMPDQIHNYAHNNAWLVSNLRHVGRVGDAVLLAKNMIELPQLAPRTEVIGRKEFVEDRSSYFLGSHALVETLVESEKWEALVALESTRYLVSRQESLEESFRLYGVTTAYASLGRIEEARERLKRMEEAVRRVHAERVEAADAAEAEARKASKGAEEVAKSAQQELQNRREKVDQADAWLAAARMSVFLAEGEVDQAAVQLLGAKKLSPVRKALAEWAVGNREESLRTIEEAANKDGGQVLRLAVQADLLNRAEKGDAAREVFEKLRRLGRQADLDLAAFGRLNELRKAFGIPEDWRMDEALPKDVGTRPPLASLGPFRWEPPVAPAWGLPTETGAWMRSLDWKGKPILLMFYLGSGCVHCIEQLNAFAPFSDAFERAGIRLIAVSVDNRNDLSKTMSKAKSGGGFPFPILADPELAAFRLYGAYDDFEGQPLHGLFLIDGDGRVRWQNISYQPFSQPEWLLQESQRLLGIGGKSVP